MCEKVEKYANYETKSENSEKSFKNVVISTQKEWFFIEPVIIFTLVIFSTPLSQFFGGVTRVQNRKTVSQKTKVFLMAVDS